MRTFLVVLAAALSAASMFSGCTSAKDAQHERTPEFDVRKPIRGLFISRWDIRGAGDAERITLNAASIGTTDLFIQVRGAGDVMYASVEPRVAHIGSAAGSEEVLGALVRAARARGIRVHAWFNVLTLAPRGQLSGDAARALALTRDGEPVESPDGYILMDPGLSATRERLGTLIEDALAAAEFDGVCLDYARLPPGAVTPEVRGALDDLVLELSARIRLAAPAAFVSVISPATPGAAQAAGQEPGEWVSGGGVDAVVAVIPSDLGDAPRVNLTAWRDALPAGSTLLAALSPTDALTPEVLLAQWRSARIALGARAHVAWFTYGGLFESGDPGQAGDMRSTGFRAARRAAVIDALGPKVRGSRPAAQARSNASVPDEPTEPPAATLDPLDEAAAPEAEVEPESEGGTGDETDPNGVIDEHQRR